MERNKFYFTFGSDKRFPYQNTYLIVVADCKGDAMTKFSRKYKDKYLNTYSALFCYDENQWNNSIKMYYPQEPAEVID